MHLYHILINWSQKFWEVYVEYRFIYEQCEMEDFVQIIGVDVNPLSPLTPDRRQVKRPTPLLQVTSNFLVFYGLSHGTTLKKKGVAVF
jgi:hypothetical protein